MAPRSTEFRVLLAQSGDREALDELLREIAPPLHGYLRTMTGSAALADDLLQECLILICGKLGGLREPRAFRTWAYRVASRLAFRRLKAETQWVSLDEELERADVAHPVLGPPEGIEPEALEQLFAELSPASRSVLALHYLDELSIAEIADVLDLPTGTVKSRLGYGLRKLRRHPRINELFPEADSNGHARGA